MWVWYRRLVYVKPKSRAETRTMASATTVTMPNREKYTMKTGRLKSMSRSSKEWVGSGTMPKMAMRTAPPAMSSVPKSIHIEKTSPRSIRAKNAFHSSETAPSGARITTGKEAIWKMDPKRFEEMNMAAYKDQRA